MGCDMIMGRAKERERERERESLLLIKDKLSKI